jgi:hypothetical protein
MEFAPQHAHLGLRLGPLRLHFAQFDTQSVELFSEGCVATAKPTIIVRIRGLDAHRQELGWVRITQSDFPESIIQFL